MNVCQSIFTQYNYSHKAVTVHRIICPVLFRTSQLLLSPAPFYSGRPIYCYHLARFIQDVLINATLSWLCTVLKVQPQQSPLTFERYTSLKKLLKIASHCLKTLDCVDSIVVC